jgi:hypothetical protein
MGLARDGGTRCRLSHPSFLLAEQRRRRPSGGGRRLLVSIVWLSLLMGRVVQNGPEDRSEMMEREGKPCVDSKRFLKREQARWDALNVCQPWFYLRLVAYGFFRLSEGA